jgi:hypothetical protein
MCGRYTQLLTWLQLVQLYKLRGVTAGCVRFQAYTGQL